MNNTCKKCGGFTHDFTWSGDASSAPICKCGNFIPPHQREKEIFYEITTYRGKDLNTLDTQKLASYLYQLEYRLDDLYKILTQSQRIEIDKLKK